MTLKPDMSNELRGMVRDVLREVLANRTAAMSPAAETVRIVTDHDLAAFVQRIIEPATLERIRTGKLRFALSGTATPSTVFSVETLTGVITEQKVGGLEAGATLVLGPGAVLTPLARDRARKLGLKIERRR